MHGSFRCVFATLKGDGQFKFNSFVVRTVISIGIVVGGMRRGYCPVGAAAAAVKVHRGSSIHGRPLWRRPAAITDIHCHAFLGSSPSQGLVVVDIGRLSAAAAAAAAAATTSEILHQPYGINLGLLDGNA